MTIIELLKTVWERDREKINKALEEVIEKLPEAYAVEAARYIAEGGKRFRGFLVLEVSRCLGGTDSDALDAAAAVELIHSSSLALDDIIDVDVERRGKPAAWIEVGLRKTVMTVYLLVTYAHKIVESRYGPLAVSRTINATFNISRGEVIDSFMDLDKAEPSLYEKLIELKTASLFQLSAELGAIASGRYDALELASDYGRSLGMIYQIADDLVDSSQGEDTPAIRLFKRWLGVEGEEKAYRIIAYYIDRANNIVGKLNCKNGSGELLKHIPLFIAYGMLGERVKQLAKYLA